MLASGMSESSIAQVMSWTPGYAKKRIAAAVEVILADPEVAALAPEPVRVIMAPISSAMGPRGQILPAARADSGDSPRIRGKIAPPSIRPEVITGSRFVGPRAGVQMRRVKTLNPDRLRWAGYFLAAGYTVEAIADLFSLDPLELSRAFRQGREPLGASS